jgi:hypothetical protein
MLSQQMIVLHPGSVNFFQAGCLIPNESSRFPNLDRSSAWSTLTAEVPIMLIFKANLGVRIFMSDPLRKLLSHQNFLSRKCPSLSSNVNSSKYKRSQIS